jgi:hypothetical protein
VGTNAVKNNAAGGKGPCGGQVGRAGKREGMAGKTGPNHPGGRRPDDKVRQLQRRLWSTAKRQPGRRFHALMDRIWRRYAPPDVGGASCAFRPIVQRVNALPNELELVISEDLDSGGERAENERVFYTLLPIIAAANNVRIPPELERTCEPPERPSEGVLSRFLRADESLEIPETCEECHGNDPVCGMF